MVLLAFSTKLGRLQRGSHLQLRSNKRDKGRQDWEPGTLFSKWQENTEKLADQLTTDQDSEHVVSENQDTCTLSDSNRRDHVVLTSEDPIYPKSMG